MLAPSRLQYVPISAVKSPVDRPQPELDAGNIEDLPQLGKVKGGHPEPFDGMTCA